MLIFRVGLIPRLLNASYLLTQLGDTAHLKCTVSFLSISISPPTSPRFIATLRFHPPFFLYYYLTPPSTLNWKISLNQLCHHLRQAMPYSTLTCTLPNTRVPLAFFSFHKSLGQGNGYEADLSNMTLSQPEHQEDVGDILNEIFVSIHSPDFKRVVRAFKRVNMDCDSGVVVTLTNRQVKFSNASSEIILIAAERECTIGGIEDGAEIVYQINLSPTTFFHDLASQTEKVWLFPTTKPGCVINFPIDSNSRFEIYFPSM